MTYALTAAPTAQTVSTDIFEYTAPSTKTAIITSVYIGQTTEFGDAASETLRVQFIKGFTVSGTAGVQLQVPVPLQTGFAAAAGLCDTHNTTLANTGTSLILLEDVWNVQAGYQWRPAPNEYIILAPSQRLVVRLAAPADITTFSGTMLITEVG